MKKLTDGCEVTDRTYYYLLDWNDDDNKKFISEKFNKQRLCDLSSQEYAILWKHAIKTEQIKL